MNDKSKKEADFGYKKVNPNQKLLSPSQVFH